MIEKLQIKNFQCHDLQEIEFDPKVTAIVGPTDSGKSSLLRAIRWVAVNRPIGKGFIQDGKKGTIVNLVTSRGKVSRARGKNNWYKVGVKKLEAFGTKVPEEVTEIVNLDEDNFSTQHSMPFWFDLSPGEVAKRLNSIVDLGLIDYLLGELQKMTKRTKTLVEVIEEREAKTEDELAGISYVFLMDDELKRIEKLVDDLKSTEQRISTLRKAIDSFERNQRTIDRKGEILRRSENIYTDLKGLLELEKRIDGIQSLLNRYRINQRTIDRKIPDVSKLKSMVEEYKQVTAKKEAIARMEMTYQNNVSKIRIQSKQISDLQAKIDEVMGETCPLCGAEL